MDIKDRLARLDAVKYFAVPKARYEQPDIVTWFDQVTMSDSSWLIPCSHTFFHPSDATELGKLNSWLGSKLPKDVENFYVHSNGAELFKIKYRSENLGDYWHTRYEVFSIERLLQKNRSIYESFRSQLRPTSKYWDITYLNYFAFCDVGDGDYLAVSLDPKHGGWVFYLDHEYGFLPYGTNITQDAYQPVASSFDKWITILIETSGGGGTGARWIPL
jgi:hypothetical protein